jgi:hypothetical protein
MTEVSLGDGGDPLTAIGRRDCGTAAVSGAPRTTTVPQWRHSSGSGDAHRPARADSRGMRILGLIAALSILLFACGDDDGGNDSSGGDTGSSTVSGEEQVCAALDNVQSAVTDVKDLDESSTIADVESTLSGVGQALGELDDAVAAASGPDLSGLESAVQDLVDALEAVPSNESFEAGLNDVETAADAVAAEARAAIDDAGCS